MKKLLTIFAVLLLTTTAYAEIDWHINGDTLFITGTGDIPDDANNTPWVNEDFKIVVISEGITRIGNYSFSNGTLSNERQLRSVTIPNTVTSIGNGAFYACTSLDSIRLPESVNKIGQSAFSFCTALTSIVIPASVKSIEIFTFISCSALTSVVIPESVKKIGERAFAQCSALTSVVIPATVDTIESLAFALSKSDLPRIFFVSWESPESLQLGPYIFIGDNNTILCVPKGKKESYAAISWNTYPVHITCKDEIITLSSDSYTYTGQEQSPTATAIANIPLSTEYKIKESSDDTYSATIPINVGNYTIKATVVSDPEIQTIADFTIAPKPITVTANSGSSTYGESSVNPGFSAIGLVNGETESLLFSLYIDKTISATTLPGDYILNVIGTLTNGNYTIESRNPATWTVNPKPITVTANGGNSTYGESPENPGYLVTGLVNNDTESVLTGLSNEFVNAQTPAGNHTLNVIGTLTNGNYIVASRNSATWTINPKPVTITANGGGSSTYGDSPVNPGFSATGLVNGETATVLTGLSNEFVNAQTSAGNHTLNVVGTLTNGNYTIESRNPATWTINPKPIAVVADYQTKNLGQPDPAFTYQVNPNLLNNDQMSGVLSCTHPESQGTYIIQQGTLTAGSNYTITYTPGLFIINPATAIDDITGNKNTMQIYPNPVNANETVTITTDDTGNAQILLYDITGKLLDTQVINGDETSITAPGQAGSYIVKWVTKNHSKSVKLIVR